MIQKNIPCLATIYDRNAEYLGTSIPQLMGNAGRETYNVLAKKYKLTGKKIQILCGTGNNGGDGYALACQLLRRQHNVEVILARPVREIRTVAARTFFEYLPASAVLEYSTKTKLDGDLLIDALLGVGATGKLRPPFDSIVRRLGKARGQLISLDVPTSRLKPELVIAYHCSKLPAVTLRVCPEPVKGLSKVSRRGDFYKEIVVPIGIPAKAETHFGPGDVQAYFPIREKTSHKGQNGQVLIVGGSQTYLGAPVFAALGAVGGGADLVNLWTPRVNLAAAKKHSPNVLVAALAGDTGHLSPAAVPAILKFLQKTSSTLVLGPGLGKTPEAHAAVRELVQKVKIPLVLDADALLPSVILSEALRSRAKSKNLSAVFTPHAGEFQRLTGVKATTAAVKRWSHKLGVTILLKGQTDIVAAPDGRIRWNDAGSPVLTTGGTGDTLAGLTGALLARGVAPFEAAGLAAFIVGSTAAELALKYESITPQQLAKTFPQVITKFLNFHGQKIS